MTIVTNFAIAAPIWIWAILAAEFIDILRIAWRRWREGPLYEPDVTKDYVHLPIHLDDISPDFKEWFEESAMRLAPLGFSVAGTYSKRDCSYKHRVYEHLLWHESGTVTYSLGAFEWPHERSMSRELISVLSNGTVVCTVSIDQPKGLSLPDLKRDKLHITYARRASVEQIYSWHLKEVEETAMRLGVDVLVFHANDHQALSTYHLRNFHAWRYREGEDNRPLLPVLPTPFGSLSIEAFREASEQPVPALAD